MTTLVGFVAGEGKDRGVILASDLTSTAESWERQGDVAVRRQSQRESQKIHVSQDNMFAVSMTGVRDEKYQEFLYDLLRGEISAEKAIGEGFFEDLLKLNLGRFEGRLWHNEYCNSLLIVSRYDGRPKIHSVWPLGRVEEKEGFTSVGSGSGEALSYLSKAMMDRLSHRQVTIGEGVKYVAGSLESASADPYTKGLDMVILTGDKTYEFGEQIRRGLARAKVKTVEEIAEKF